jgi:hypothetical protein
VSFHLLNRADERAATRRNVQSVLMSGQPREETLNQRVVFVFHILMYACKKTRVNFRFLLHVLLISEQQCEATVDLPLTSHSYGSSWSATLRDGRLVSATAWASGSAFDPSWVKLSLGACSQSLDLRACMPACPQPHQAAS